MESDHNSAGKPSPPPLLSPTQESLEQPLEQPLEQLPPLPPSPKSLPDGADIGTNANTETTTDENSLLTDGDHPHDEQQQQQQEQEEEHHNDVSGTIVDEPSDYQMFQGATDEGGGGGGGTTASSTVDPSDRVFPIRSVISVDHSQTTPWPHARGMSDANYFPRLDTTWSGRRRPSTPCAVTTAAPPPQPSSSTLPPASPSDNGPNAASRPTRSDTINSSPNLPVDVQQTGELSAAAATLPMFSDRISDGRISRASADGTASLSNGLSNYFNDALSTTSKDVDHESFVSTRFQHVTTDHGHAIITGRDGALQRCEDEPIHIPGAVQAFGLLIALGEEPDGQFVVRLVSENSKKIIGYSPHDLFKLGSFTDLLSDEQAENLMDHIDFIRDEESDPASSGPDVFIISLRPPRSKSIKLWCAIHINRNHPDLIICEFEPENDQQHPIRPPDESTPEGPHDTLYQSPTAEELHESTEISSKPLRVLRSARNRRGEAGAMQVFDIMSQVQEQFAAASNLDKFLKILVGIVKELTGFHRVMVYQFDSAFNGKVVTELVDSMQTRDLYHGLHFPASDIPKQARDLYKVNKVRLLYDRDLESARLVCRNMEDLERPLDLSHSYLRAMSPIHLKYLGNMGVRSSMSISINAFGELWGLISCHGYGPKGMRVSFPIRKMCRMIGDNASRNIERLSYASRLQSRKLINTMPTDKNPSGYIIASSDDLLKLFDADFGMLSIGDETKVLGRVEQSQEALALLEYLRLRNFTAVLTTQDVTQDFPDLRYTPGFTVIAGLLYVPLSVGGHDFIVFFRKGQTREVKWAGNPYEKNIKVGTAGLLEPRSSFKTWRETVVGKCRDWSEEQVETAAVLCLVYGKFIEVWRQKEAALQNSRLTRLLLANSAHEVRTPLNAIINYLEIALEGSIDRETRDNLAKSHSASKSLIYVINDLLDLTKAEEGQELVKDEIMDLPACISEATEPFKADAKRKNIAFEVFSHPGFPKYVHGDYRRVRQVVANVTANAVQNTSEGSVKVECFVVEVQKSRVRVEITVHDTGCGMSNEHLDNLFQDLEQVSSADFGETDSFDTSLSNGDRDNRTLGLGLAVVARTVRNMDGQLRLKSEKGKGSRFVIQIPFDLPSSDALEELDKSYARIEASSDTGTLASVTTALPPTQAGEVTLVDRGSSIATHSSHHSISKARSFDETNSMHSFLSNGSGGARSNKSDADRLIDAIQTPFDTRENEREMPYPRRTSSEGRRPYSSASASSLPALGASQTFAPQTTMPPPNLDVTKSAGAQPGVYPIQYSNTPLKPVKVPDTYVDQPKAPQTDQSSRVLFEIPKTPQTNGEAQPKAHSNTKPGKLRVLIAEDDPVNMKVLTKRLQKAGHEIYPAVNGEDCAAIYKERSAGIDVVLMDMQMPIVDGVTSTKLIREFEKSDDCQELSTLGQLHGHIPIFAVSASLVEKDKAIYTEAGFDGWILKPIDFKRLNIILDGITRDDVREDCLYQPGEWERGGWFARRAAQ